MDERATPYGVGSTLHLKIFSQRQSIYVWRVPTEYGHHKKWRNNPSEGKHGEFGNLSKTLGKYMRVKYLVQKCAVKQSPE